MARLGDSGGERLFGDIEQPLRLGLDLADRERVGAVRDVRVQRDPDVDRDEVAVLDPVRPRDPVHDDVVRRDADGLRVPLVPRGGGDPVPLPDEGVGGRIELVRGDTRRDQRADMRDGLGHERPRGGDTLDLPCALADDHGLTTLSESASTEEAWRG